MRHREDSQILSTSWLKLCRPTVGVGGTKQSCLCFGFEELSPEMSDGNAVRGQALFQTPRCSIRWDNAHSLPCENGTCERQSHMWTVIRSHASGFFPHIEIRIFTCGNKTRQMDIQEFYFFTCECRICIWFHTFSHGNKHFNMWKWPELMWHYFLFTSDWLFSTHEWTFSVSTLNLHMWIDSCVTHVYLNFHM